MTEKNDTMVRTKVSFGKRFNGYSRKEVNRYIDNLSTAYRSAYDEYAILNNEHDELLEKYELLKTQTQDTASSDMAAQTLYNTELLAQQIINDANEAAAETKAEARMEAKKIIEDAYMESANEYASVYGKQDDMVEKYEQPESRMQDTMSSDVAENTLNGTEILAQQVIIDANEAAADMKADAHMEAQKIIEDAHMEKVRMITEAKRILGKANADAIFARKGRQLAEEAVREAIYKMQSLLSTEPQGAYTII